MRARMIWMLLLTGAAFAVIFGIKWLPALGGSRNVTSMPAATVSSARVETQLWTRTVSAVGTFRALQGTQIAPEVEGLVGAIRFESGQPAAAGQVLIELDAGAERAKVAALEAQLALAQAQRSRYQDLYAQRLTARAELDARISEADRIAAELRAEQALLAKKVLRAPFGGELGIRQVSLGDYLKAGDPVVSLQALDPIALDFTLSEDLLGQVGRGLGVSAELDAYPDAAFEGRVTAIEPQVDADTRTFRMRAELPNPERRLRPGAFARVRVRIGEPQAVLAVPQTAIRFDPYGNSVFVIAGPEGARAVAQRFVRTGQSQGDYIAVLEGLSEGEEVAAGGLLKLSNGDRVQIDNRLAPAPERDPQPVNR